MSTSSLGQTRLSKLAEEILTEMEVISKEFALFQEKSNLSCLPSCGKCCFKPDIFCTPYELLPLAVELVEKKMAQSFYERLQENKDSRCALLHVTNEEKYQGYCDQYKHRPLLCRTFGVSARHGKNNEISFSVCRPLKESKTEAYNALSSRSQNIAFIEYSRNRLSAIDPLLLKEEFPINEALKIILEKVLFYSSYTSPA